MNFRLNICQYCLKGIIKNSIFSSVEQFLFSTTLKKHGYTDKDVKEVITVAKNNLSQIQVVSGGLKGYCETLLRNPGIQHAKAYVLDLELGGTGEKFKKPQRL